VNQTFRKIISFFLLASFLVATTPDDLLHLFANHHDTVDSNSTTTAVSIKHIHCEALQLSLPSFSKTESTDLSAAVFFIASFYSIILEPAAHIHYVAANGRAPPCGA
jgi:hypothetical protein